MKIKKKLRSYFVKIKTAKNNFIKTKMSSNQKHLLLTLTTFKRYNPLFLVTIAGIRFSGPALNWEEFVSLNTDMMFLHFLFFRLHKSCCYSNQLFKEKFL